MVDASADLVGLIGKTSDAAITTGLGAVFAF